MLHREIVARFSSRIEAELACSMLREHDIDARIAADDAGGQHPELSMLTGGVRLAVAPEDVELARALLDAGIPDLDDAEADDDPAGATLGGSRLGRRRRRAMAIVAVAVVILLVVFAEAVRQGGMLHL